MRVAVIGSGVVGACVGWHLAGRGVEVVFVDAHQPGAGVTDCSFAWCNASSIVLEYHRALAGSRGALGRGAAEGAPAGARADTLVRAYFDLGVAGMAAHRDLAAHFRAGEWWHPTGHLRWFDDPVDIHAHRAAADQLQAWGYEAVVWHSERVTRLLEPDVHFQTADTEVVFCADEAWVEGRTLACRLIDDALQRGATMLAGQPVTDVVLRNDIVAGVVLGGKEHLVVDAVVNAAGPAGHEVAGFIGRALPMIDEPGLIARLRCARVPVRRAMHAPHVQIRPDGDGRVVLHSRDIDARIGQFSVAELAVAIRDLAIDVVPALATAEPIDARLAWRPLPVDRLPSIGAVSGVRGYFEAVTHGGITLGVVLGRLLAQEIIDGTVDRLIESFRPDRFASTERGAL